MTGRGYMGEVLNQVWLKPMKKWVSNWTNKLIIILRKTSGVHTSPHKKCAMKWKKQTRIKRCARKNVIHGRKPFIAPKQKTDGNDLHELLGNDCGYSEGTICVLSGWSCVKRMVFWAWAHEQVSLNSQWLVLRISGADFLHCWVVDSIWLELAESLITKR